MPDKCGCGNIDIYDGTIITVDRFPDTKWIAHNGHYTYEGQHCKGWFANAIPTGIVAPLSAFEGYEIHIVDNAQPCPGPDPCPKPGPHPKPHPKPPEVKSPERYYGGVNYLQGQLIYLELGNIYQAVIDFKSSWRQSTLQLNFETDVQSGYLIPISSGSPSDIERRLNDHINAPNMHSDNNYNNDDAFKVASLAFDGDGTKVLCNNGQYLAIKLVAEEI